MEKDKVQLGVSPLRWLSMKGWLGDEGMKLFKGCCYVRAWDPDSKTWFYPENFDPLVRSALGLPQTAAPNIRLEPFPRDGEIKHRVALGRATGGAAVFSSVPLEPHWLDSDPYKILMVDEDAPQWLVDWAAIGWREALKSAGGPPEPLERVNAAYEEIIRSRLAHDEVSKQLMRGAT